MGKRQRKKLSNGRQILQQSRALAAPSSSTMTPAPLCLGATIPVDDSPSVVESLPLTDCTSCRHIESGVNLDKLRREFTTKPAQECHDCCTHAMTASKSKSKKGKPKPPAAAAAAAAGKKVMWICLACGQIGCSSHVLEDQHVGCRVGDSHATQQQHYVVMKWGESLHCLCLKCKTQLQYPSVVDKSAHQPDLLHRAATLLQEILFRKPSPLKVEADHIPEVPEEVPDVPEEVPDVPEEVPDVPEVSEVEEDSTPPKAMSPLTSRRVMKGLTNLGNTCFFNSVMQNLVGVSMLREHFSKEPSEEEGLLKVSLRKFFQEMDPSPVEKADESSSGFGYYDRTRSFGGNLGNAVSPRGLFSVICTKAPRFKGFQQQDSHELLRCLLDGLHMEEESIRKNQPGADSNAKDEGSPDTLVVHMFGGQLSSTMSCCECRHSSVVYEPFLDLSLPIPSKQSFAKVVPICIQLPKLIAQRSQRGGDLSGNGVLSVSKAAGFSSFDSGLVDNKTSAMEAPPKPGIAPVFGFDLERSVSDDGPGNCETSNQPDSASGEAKRGCSTTCDKDQGLDLTGYPFASSSRTEKIDAWLDFMGDPKKSDFEDIGASLVLDSDATGATGSGAADVNQARDGEAHPQEEQLDDIPLDNEDQMEEGTIVYGPDPLGATGFGPENQSECLAMVLSMPGKTSSEEKAQAVDEIPAGVQSNTTSTSNGKPGPIAPVKLLSRGSDNLDGVAALFDDDESSTGPRYGTQIHKSSSFNNLDSLVAVPAFSGERTELNLGPVSGYKSGSAMGVRDVETYPTMSLEGCLQAFTKTEMLSGENAWACENCSRIAYRQREAEQQETNYLKQSPENEGHCRDVGPTARLEGEWESVGLEDCVASMDLSTSTNSRPMVAVSQGSVEKLDQQENGTIIVASSEQFLGLLDDKQNAVEMVDGRAGVNLAALSNTSLLSKSHNRASSNTLNRFPSLDCFDESEGPRPGKAQESRPSSSQEGKGDAGEPYAMVGVSSEFDDDTASSSGRRQRNDAVISVKNARNSDMVMKDRKGKASATTDLMAGASMPKEVIGTKVEKEAPKMVTVKRDATKRFLISKAPLVLTVHLKRFAQDMHGRLSKLSGHITFHEQLDLGPFIDQRDGNKQGGVYQLIGTVEHSGTMRGGHYVAYVKGSKTETEDGIEGATSTWYYISDSHVRKTSLEAVLQSEAYLLFYERQAFE